MLELTLRALITPCLPANAVRDTVEETIDIG
jgi:hypothetical protein